MEPTRFRKGCERDERHNKSAHVDDCRSGSGSVLWAADIQEQLDCRLSRRLYNDVSSVWWQTNIMCEINDTIQTGSINDPSLFITAGSGDFSSLLWSIFMFVVGRWPRVDVVIVMAAKEEVRWRIRLIGRRTGWTVGSNKRRTWMQETAAHDRTAVMVLTVQPSQSVLVLEIWITSRHRTRSAEPDSLFFITSAQFWSKP